MGITKYMLLGLAAFALAPMPPEGAQTGNDARPAATLQTHEMISVAIGTFTDVASFCQRQPQACDAIGNIAAIAEAKAKYSVRLMYEWANGGQIPNNSPASGLKGTLPASDPGQDINLVPLPPVDATQTSGSTSIFKSSMAVDQMFTGSTLLLASADEGTNTLRIDDLVPEWHGPEEPRQS
jgi:hypothetical protein